MKQERASGQRDHGRKSEEKTELGDNLAEASELAEAFEPATDATGLDGCEVQSQYERPWRDGLSAAIAAVGHRAELDENNKATWTRISAVR